MLSGLVSWCMLIALVLAFMHYNSNNWYRQSYDTVSPNQELGTTSTPEKTQTEPRKPFGLLKAQAISSKILTRMESEVRSIEGAFVGSDDSFLPARLTTETRCMAENIYREAGAESMAGKIAVALVTKNRVEDGNFAPTVCGVVHQKVRGICQFSWACQKGLRNLPEDINSRNWQQWKDSVLAAEMVLNHGVIDFTHGALKFFAHWQVNPIWAKIKDVTVVIGNHTFVK